ncbi:MAG: ChbG/HpnK family deacetylase [Anaerolineales bacterium]|nr:ChbG/HpnK family deacetylase [Anaerolineales bacterium]
MHKTGISLITRADDLGSSHSANIAIAESALTGAFIRNISCMAVGPWIDEGAELLKNQHDVCLGLHATLISEWNRIKWGPVSSPEQVSSLVNKQGVFHSDPTWFAEHPPDIDQILLEYDHQLDLLTSLRLDIRYIDSHMLPELFVEGLAEAVSEWARQKGLIDHLTFYRFPARMEPGTSTNVEQGLQAFRHWLDLLVHGTYFSVMHPAKASREMLLFSNVSVPVGLVSTCRDVEYQLLRSRSLEQACNERSIRRLRYDEAESQGTTLHDLRNYLEKAQQETTYEQKR